MLGKTFLGHLSVNTISVQLMPLDVDCHWVRRYEDAKYY